MKNDKRAGSGQTPAASASIPTRILGSLRDALNAASREDRSGEISLAERSGSARAAPAAGTVAQRSSEIPAKAAAPAPAAGAVEAAREAKAPARELQRHVEVGEPTTQALRGPAALVPGMGAAAGAAAQGSAKTQVLRGRAKVAHGKFHQDPVVAWLVVVGGAGLGAFRPIYEGNNSVGRGKNQRIPIDFGDDTISTEEQAYIRYDSMDRSFLFVPNLSKTNIVAVNDKKPTGAVKLELMDVITMGRTQLAFVPFCGEDFDWSELSDLKE
jgi:hypothetical protein